MPASIKEYFIYFIVGGVVTTLIISLERGGSRLWSGVATLMPIFTLVAYFFIGETRGGAAVAQHAWLVLIGTLVAWVPYMIIVALLAPRYGTEKAIPVGLTAFFVLAAAYLEAVHHFGWFQ